MATGKDSANLDFVRACAVLTVYIGHFLQTFHVIRLTRGMTVWDFTQTGVLIFFVHTSLVLMMSMERLKLNSSRFFAVFYTRRAFRIYPLSIVTVLLLLACHVPDFPTNVYEWPGGGRVLSNLLLSQNLTRVDSYPAVLWSLPFEVQMYLVLPALFLLLRRFWFWWFPLLLWVGTIGMIGLAWIAGLSRIAALLQYAPCFIGGILGYRLWYSTRLNLRFWGWPCLILACIALRIGMETTPIPHATTVSAWLACLFLGLGVAHFQELGPGRVRKAAAVVAKYSYGIYLSHCAIFWLAFVVLGNTPRVFQAVVCLALSVLAPLTLFHTVEKPMIGVGVRLADKFARSARNLSMAAKGAEASIG